MLLYEVNNHMSYHSTYVLNVVLASSICKHARVGSQLAYQ